MNIQIKLITHLVDNNARKEKQKTKNSNEQEDKCWIYNVLFKGNEENDMNVQN